MSCDLYLYQADLNSQERPMSIQGTSSEQAANAIDLLVLCSATAAMQMMLMRYFPLTACLNRAGIGRFCRS